MRPNRKSMSLAQLSKLKTCGVIKFKNKGKLPLILIFMDRKNKKQITSGSRFVLTKLRNLIEKEVLAIESKTQKSELSQEIERKNRETEIFEKRIFVLQSENIKLKEESIELKQNSNEQDNNRLLKFCNWNPKQAKLNLRKVKKLNWLKSKYTQNTTKIFKFKIKRFSLKINNKLRNSYKQNRISPKNQKQRLCIMAF